MKFTKGEKGKKLTQISFNERVSAKVNSTMTGKDMLKLSAALRQSIANSAAIFMRTLLENKYKLECDDGSFAAVVNDSLKYKTKLDICPKGYQLHSNGFLCGKFD